MIETYVPSPYVGPNSLKEDSETRRTREMNPKFDEVSYVTRAL